MPITNSSISSDSSKCINTCWWSVVNKTKKKEKKELTASGSLSGFDSLSLRLVALGLNFQMPRSFTGGTCLTLLKMVLM